MNARKIKKPKRAYDELDIAEAAGLYIDYNGDIDKLKTKLGRKWIKNDLRYYEDARHWPMLLSRTQQQVDERIVEDAVKRRADQLARLRNIRVTLYRKVVPVADGIAANAHSLEGCATALCKIIEMEREITGDKLHVAPPSAGIFVFLRDRILREGSIGFKGNRASGAPVGDPTDRFRF